MSIALGAPQKSPLGAFVKSALGVRGFSGFPVGDLFLSGDFTALNGNAALTRVVAWDKASQSFVDANAGMDINGFRGFVMFEGALLGWGSSSNPTLKKYTPGARSWANFNRGDSGDDLSGNIHSVFIFQQQLYAASSTGNLSTPNTGTLGEGWLARYVDPGWEAVANRGAWGTETVRGAIVAFGKIWIYGRANSSGTSDALLLSFDGSAWDTTPTGAPHSTAVYVVQIVDAMLDGTDLLLAVHSSSATTNPRINAGVEASHLVRWNGVGDETFESIGDTSKVYAGPVPFSTTGNGGETHGLIQTSTDQYALGVNYADQDSVPAVDDQFGGICKIVGASFTSLNGGVRTSAGGVSTGIVASEYDGLIVLGANSAIVNAGHPTPDVTGAGLFAWDGSAWSLFQGCTGIASGDIQTIFNTGVALE